MSSKPLVSAIIIFLNEEKFIQEAIDSVFAQTYDNWELLLVDDGSTDHSVQIAQRCAEQYPEKVRYIEHPNHANRGMSASRNLGVRSAKGKYISYLDGDDIWLPNKLERQVEILQSNPEAVMVYGPLQLWYSWAGNPEDRKRECLYGVDANGMHPYSNTLVKPPQLLTLFLRDEDFIPSSILVEREIIERVGGYEDIFREGYSDAVIFVKLCLTSSVFVSGESWYKYRQHPESSTHQSWVRGDEDAEAIFYLNWIEKYFSQQGVKDTEVWQALRTALWPYRHPRLKRLLEIYRHPIRYIKELVKLIGRLILPASVRCWLRTQWQGNKYYPPLGE